MEHGLDLYEQNREPHHKLPSSTEVITRPTELQPEFECPICLELLNETTITLCMHRFCKDCIVQAIGKSTDKLCPICKAKITSVRSLRADTKFDDMIELLFPKDFEDDQMEEAAQFIKAATITQKKNNEVHLVLRKLVPLRGGATGVDPHGPSRTIKVSPIQCTIAHVIKYLQFTDELFGSLAPQEDLEEEDETILIFSKVDKLFTRLEESKTLEDLIVKDRVGPLELYFQIV